MAENAESEERAEEFVLEADSELRFEIETKNEKVTVEVSILLNFFAFIFACLLVFIQF